MPNVYLHVCVQTSIMLRSYKRRNINCMFLYNYPNKEFISSVHCKYFHRRLIILEVVKEMFAFVQNVDPLPYLLNPYIGLCSD
jgi:hypothetical protein